MMAAESGGMLFATMCHFGCEANCVFECVSESISSGLESDYFSLLSSPETTFGLCPVSGLQYKKAVNNLEKI